MSQITFDPARPAAQAGSGRADVACFVGLARRAGFVIDPAVRPWFASQGLLRFPFAPATGAPAPSVPLNVRAWFLSQGWITGIVSSAATSDVIGSLATGIAADTLQITTAVPLADEPPLFARIGTEIVAIAQVDALGTTLTIARGAASTHAVAHSQGDAIVAVAVDPFAALTAQLANAIPATVESWLQKQGWLTGRFARDLDQLYDVPVPFENYAGFTQMFDPGGSAASAGTDYVATAIASFFAQGGKRCYLVCMGSPIAPTDTPGELAAKLQAILLDPSHQGGDPTSWHGVGHLAGLPDVSFLAVPDLPILCASAPPANVEFEPAVPAGPVQFAECAQGDMTLREFRLYPSSAPRLGPADYGRWAASIANVLQYLTSGRSRQELQLREIQFVAAFPLPQAAGVSDSPAADQSDVLAQDLHDVFAAYFLENVEPSEDIAAPNISSAFLQLAYPWLQTTASAVLSESLEPPDGALVGILARNALKYGAFNSATKVTPAGIFGLWPTVPTRETKISAPALTWGPGTPEKPLVSRVSLFGSTPRGIRLLSDVTAFPGEAYRDAAVNRLVSIVCRAARRMGEAVVFASNGPALWGRVQSTLQKLMTRLWNANAFDGASIKDAFAVRCDQSTMTQNDLDNGRLVAEVAFTPAAKIDLIRVTLTFEADATSAQQIASSLAEAV